MHFAAIRLSVALNYKTFPNFPFPNSALGDFKSMLEQKADI